MPLKSISASPILSCTRFTGATGARRCAVTREVRLSIAGVARGSFTYSYRISVYSVSISATQGASSAPSETSNPVPTPPASRDQFRSDLTALFQAVKGGDMTAAKEALQTVQADRPGLFDASLKATGSKVALQSDFQSLVSAVQSGDSASAQGALTKLRLDVKEGRGHPTVSRQAAASATSATPGSAAPVGDKDGDGDSH